MRAKEISWQAQKHPKPIVRNQFKGPNPFSLPTSTDLYQQREEAEQERKRQFKAKKNLTTVQRAITTAPNSSRRAIRDNYKERMKVDDLWKEGDVKPVAEIRQKQQHTTQLIQQQREIFLTNLLISRHEQEIERIMNQKEAKGNRLAALDVELKESQNIMKTSTSQNENIRERYHQRYIEQCARKNKLMDEVKAKKSKLQQMGTEITKLEEVLAQYQAYDNLLQEISHMTGERPKTIDEFMVFFDKLENEDLFIVQHVDTMQAKTEETDFEIDAQIKKVEKSIQELNEQIEKLDKLKDNDDSSDIPIQGKPAPHLDKESSYLQKHIGATFRQCFKTTEADQSQSVVGQNSLTMLTMIESQIEEMTRVFKTIDPAIATKKLKLLTERKRKEQREANQLKKELDQKRKIDQMKERATKPIKKSDGRPLVSRIQITRTKSKDPEKREKELLEKARIENLLFGSIYD